MYFLSFLLLFNCAMLLGIFVAQQGHLVAVEEVEEHAVSLLVLAATAREDTSF